MLENIDLFSRIAGHLFFNYDEHVDYRFTRMRNTGRLYYMEQVMHKLMRTSKNLQTLCQNWKCAHVWAIDGYIIVNQPTERCCYSTKTMSITLTVYNQATTIDAPLLNALKEHRELTRIARAALMFFWRLKWKYRMPRSAMEAFVGFEVGHNSFLTFKRIKDRLAVLEGVLDNTLRP